MLITFASFRCEVTMFTRRSLYIDVDRPTRIVECLYHYAITVLPVAIALACEPFLKPLYRRHCGVSSGWSGWLGHPHIRFLHTLATSDPLVSRLVPATLGNNGKRMAASVPRLLRIKRRRLTLSAISLFSRYVTIDLGCAILDLVADAIKPLEILALESLHRQRERVVRESETEFSGEVSCLSLEIRVDVTSRFEITCVAHPVIGDPHAVDQSLEEATGHSRRGQSTSRLRCRRLR